MSLLCLQSRLAVFLLLGGSSFLCEAQAAQGREQQRRGWSEFPVGLDAEPGPQISRGWSGVQDSAADVPVFSQPRAPPQSAAHLATGNPALNTLKFHTQLWQLVGSAITILAATVVGYMLGRWHGKVKHIHQHQHVQPASLDQISKSFSSSHHVDLNVSAAQNCDNVLIDSNDEREPMTKSECIQPPSTLDKPTIQSSDLAQSSRSEAKDALPSQNGSNQASVMSSDMASGATAEIPARYVAVPKHHPASSGMSDRKAAGLAAAAQPITDSSSSEHAPASAAAHHAAPVASTGDSSWSTSVHGSAVGMAYSSSPATDDQQDLSCPATHVTEAHEGLEKDTVRLSFHVFKKQSGCTDIPSFRTALPQSFSI